MEDGAARSWWGRRWLAGWRRWLPWVVAAAILAWLFASTPVGEVRDALARVNLLGLAGLAVGFVLALLLADASAMWVAFREALRARTVRFRDCAAMRAASYLLALVNYGAGQGGIIYYLNQKHGVRVRDATGAVLLASGAFVLVVAVAVGAGLAAGAVPETPEIHLFTIAALAGVPIYLAVIAWRPGILARRAILAPLFDAGVAGTLRVAAARAVHLGVLLAGHWAAMRLFGIRVPAAVALAQLPVVFLVATVPVAPSGLGTTQAAAVTLFAGYAPGATDAAREAAVLAYSLSFQVAGSAVAATLGLVGLRVIGRHRPEPFDTGSGPS